MNVQYVVFTETENGDRWFYGLYSEARAYMVAESLNEEVGESADFCYMVCAWDEVEDMEIKNLPAYFFRKRGY